MKKRLLGILFSLALMLTMMPVLGLGQTAYAGERDTWSANKSFDSDASFPDGVNITDNITITIAEGKTVTVENGIDANGKTLTVEGKGNLIVNGYNSSWGSGGPAFTGRIIVEDGKVTLTGGAGNDGPNDTGGNGIEGNVEVRGGSFSATGGNGYTVGRAVSNTITCENGIVAQESTNGSGWSDISGTSSNKQYVRTIQTYPLWVGGTRVTSANMSGDGWSYTPAPDGETPATLTLNNFSCTGGEGAVISATESLVIELTGNNTVGSTSNNYGINVWNNEKLTIQGNGILNAIGSDYGIYADNDITIEGCDVIATSTGTGMAYYAGIYSDGSIEIKGGSVNASAAGGNAIDASNGVTIEGASVVASATASGIYTINSDVIIKDGSKVTASGDVRAINCIGGNVKNSIAGTGWSDKEGTKDETAIAINTDGQKLTGYKKVQFDKVTVKFDSDEGSPVASQTITVGGKATKPADPTRSGYTFEGWYLGSTAFDFDSAIEKSITLTAHWKKVTPAAQSTITYDLNGGTLNGETGKVAVKVNNGTVITLPEPTRDGYTFDYWEGSKYNAGDKYTVNGDHTFKAVWKTGASGDGSKGGSSKKGVNTGDENTLGAWIVLLMATLAGTTGMVATRKRK